MKIGMFSPFATVAPHFEAELELLQQHIDAGDEVHYLHCDGKLANCDFNIDREADRCTDCLGRRQHGIEVLSGACRVSTIDLQHTYPVPEFKSLPQLIDFEIDGFDVGYATLSSLVSVCRDPEPDLVKYQSLLQRFMDAALTTYQQTLDFIEQHQPDRVYVFNGRFAAMRAVLRACQKCGVDCFLHERGKNKDHYDLYPNHLPHDLDGVDALIRKIWNEADVSKRESVGASWYQDRFDRVETAWKSFTKDQQYGSLPEGFSDSQRNISIFTSSDDEFVAIGDGWRNTLYPEQVQAIAKIASDMLEASPQTRLYVRAHPNLKDVDNARKRSMLALDFPNLTVIGPETDIDTYALVKASDIVVSFGSSVGMEAVYWGRPSVLLGPCLYQSLGGPIRSESHEHTIELLCGEHAAADKTGALMYGHWFQARGFPYRYFQATDFFEGKFKGEVLYNRGANPPRKRKRWKSMLPRVLRGSSGKSSG